MEAVSRYLSWPSPSRDAILLEGQKEPEISEEGGITAKEIRRVDHVYVESESTLEVIVTRAHMRKKRQCL